MTDSNGASDRLSHGADRYFGKPVSHLTPVEQTVLERAAARRTLARDTDKHFSQSQGFGDKLADQIARFGGSWMFIGSFLAILAIWVASNLWLASAAPDPYPFIFLNLVLSMLAALQAPIIMMSQNRQAAKDRLAAEHDYQINLKAELEIMALHDKLDQMREGEITALLDKQQQQIELLTKAVMGRS